MIYIKTYEDLIAVGESETARMDFAIDAIGDHKLSSAYQTALDAELYDRELNPTIMRFQKFVTNVLGAKVPDVWSANNKIASNWYHYFVTQSIQYLLGNGVQFANNGTKGKLGKNFDREVQTVARHAKNGGCGFGFWNLDHIEPMGITEFVPLYGEETGALMAGIRFWQLANDKPLRITLYEIDGYTDYIKKNDRPMEVMHPKRGYKKIVKRSPADGEEIKDGGNYDGFPIVPLFNVKRQSELVGKQGTIDAYDLMISGLVNNVSDGEFIYWILKNCGGMSEEEDEEFIERLHMTHVAHTDGDGDGSEVEAHQVNVPFEASQASLSEIRAQLYKDFMALNVDEISSGNVTATQIRSAYEPINEKTDEFEYCVNDFVNGILALAGINDEPNYVRSVIANQMEDVQTLLSAAEYLDDDFTVRRLCAILGCPDDAEAILRRRDAESSSRFRQFEKEEKEEGENAE